MSTCQTVTTPDPPPDRMGHLRSLLREGRAWRGVPSRRYPGCRLYDPTGSFRNIREIGHFIHLYRHAHGSIHFHARRHFVEVVRSLAGLGVKCQVRRVKVDGHYAEVFEVSRGPVMVLVVIRNWVNPVFEREIVRVVRVLEQHARTVQLEGRYNRVCMCLVAPALARGQTSLDRLHIRFLSMEYIVLPSMVERIARQAGVDYSYAFPSQGHWSEVEIDRLRGELLRFFQEEATAALDATEYTRTLEPEFLRAPAPTPHVPGQPGSGSGFAPNPHLSSSYIDPIRERASETPSSFMSGLDPPCVRKFPSSNPSRPVSSPSLLERTASTSLPTLGEEEEAQLRMWVRDARIITNRYYRINFIRCLIINNLALHRSPPHVTTLIRALIRKAWGLNRRTTLEYCSIAYSMLHDNEDTYKIRNVTNTRRKRIRHLYLKLIWDRDLQANPWRLIPYAMRMWGVRHRTAWDYEQAAWLAFNRKEDFLEEASASCVKTTRRTIYLYDLALDHPHLAQEPIKLTQIAMRLWGVQRRTADGLTRRVRAMLT